MLVAKELNYFATIPVKSFGLGPACDGLWKPLQVTDYQSSHGYSHHLN